MNLKTLRWAAAEPTRFLALLGERRADKTPALAKALLRASRAIERRPSERFLRSAEIALIDRDLIGALNFLRFAIASQPTVSAIYGIGARIAQSDFSKEAYEEAIDRTIENGPLKAMLIALLNSPQAYHPSRFWLYFMLFNAYQIEALGVENFKRTANNNYFTWTGDIHVDEQAKALEAIVGAVRSTTPSEKPAEFQESKWRRYERFLLALFAYAKSKDSLGVLDGLEEPMLGNPIYATIDAKRVTQDLCHTSIELNTILRETRVTPRAFTVYELGAGHGRIGFALLTMFPQARYVVIDIPPALHVSQWYLSSLFDRHRVFRFREFTSYSQVAAEFEESRIAFLLPHQASMLPDKGADLFINICSLQEMTREHVALWFGQIDRLCRGHFYTKQYLHHANDIDRIKIDRGDYPVRPHWSPLLDRRCEAFPSLFEALYRIPSSG